MTSPDPSKQFEEELEGFRREIHGAIQFFYGFMAINEVVSRDKKALKLVNETPLFWKTMAGGLQTSYFITLGRIFDINRQTGYNIKSLMILAEQYKGIFSKASLAERKRASSSSLTDTDINNYVTSAYEPTNADFQELTELVDQQRKIYTKNYDDIRDKVYAHKERSSAEYIQGLFAKTNVNELEAMFTFFNQLHDALWELFHNGRKPELRPMEHSTKNIMDENLPEYRSQTVQQAIVKETQQLFELLATSEA